MIAQAYPLAARRGGRLMDAVRRAAAGVVWALEVHHACDSAARQGRLDGETIRGILLEADRRLQAGTLWS
jgi:hypothetical protein